LSLRAFIAVRGKVLAQSFPLGPKEKIVELLTKI
jgi:hypothetical protein